MSDETLGMDILNELIRCPAPLFDLLSSEDQKKFRMTSDDADSSVEREILMRRYKERYPYFALNYLDRRKKLERICFHLNLGNYYFGLHERSLIDGTILPDRRMKKRILSFSRIQDAETRYFQERDREGSLYWSTQNGGTPPAEYRTDMKPQYHINDQQIGLRISRDIGNWAEHPKQVPQTAPLGRASRNPKPDCWLSLYELPILAFLVSCNEAKSAETQIVKYVENWHGFLNEILRTRAVPAPEKFHLDPTEIPDEIRYYQKTGRVRPFNMDLLKKDLERHIERTERDLGRFRDEQKYDFTPGKKARRNYRNGRIASWITRELLLFQPSNGEKPKHGKISSPDFAVLQASLSMFGETKDTLSALFQRAGLLNNPSYPHPFLAQVMKSDLLSLASFFENYLNTKLAFFKRLQTTLSRPDELNWKTGNFYIFRRHFRRLEAKRSGSDYLCTMVERLKKEPVNLPRNLFYPLVENLIRRDWSVRFQSECGSLTRCNSTFLIMKYHEWSGDHYPWYYSLPKSKRAAGYRKLFELLRTDPLDDRSVRILKERVKKSLLMSVRY